MSRIIPGLVLAACWLLLLLSGYFLVFWVAVVLITLIAGYEYCKMALPEEVGANDSVLLIGIIAIPVIMTGFWQYNGLCAGLFFSFFFSTLYIIYRYDSLSDRYGLLSRLVFGSVYIGFLIAHLLLLWHLPEGNLWLIILVAITAGSDSGAYYFGKQFGKSKLCRHVSPNKTREGALGGLLCGVAAAVLFASILLSSVNWVILLPMAILLTGVGIIGDLCESVVKRGTSTKDSGRILLGHGGILDRVDSMIVAAPLLYYFLVLVG